MLPACQKSLCISPTCVSAIGGQVAALHCRGLKEETKQQFERALRSSGLGVRPKDGRDCFALWCDLAGIPQGWKRALMGHRAENVTQEYGWQESERILGDAEVKLQALIGDRKSGGQMGGHPSGKPRKSNAPRRTRTPSLLIRSHLNGDSKRHAATRAVIPRRTRSTVH